MEQTERLDRGTSQPFRLEALRFDPPALAAWVLGAAIVTYLALQGGGYDPIIRGEVGVAVWWVVLAGVTTGLFALPKRPAAALTVFGLLLAYAVWTALAFNWTSSDERTATELARVATYAGFLALGIFAAADGRARHLLAGVTTAVGVVAALAVLSRLHPQWFPANEIGTFLPGIEIERRLAYPLNYSSAVGVLAAITIPLLLGATAWAKTLTGQALAAAALPLAGFMAVLASSGTGTGAVIVALLAFIVLAPDRLPKLGTIALGAAGTAILAAGLTDRPALDRGLPTPDAIAQGDELLVIAIVVCLGVALAQTAIGLAVRFGRRPALMEVSRRNAWIATGLALLVAAPIALAAGLPGVISDGIETFQSRGGTDVDQTDRGAVLLDASSSGRYQFWESAARAGTEEPLTGIGPGTFEFYWAQDPENFGFVRDAHSLYMESLAELGFVGLGLIVALVGGILGFGAWRCATATGAARMRIAAATAAAVGFAVGAALDWIWEIAALPAIFFLLAAVIAIDRDPEQRDPAKRNRERSRSGSSGVVRKFAPRIAAAGVAIAAIAAIWFPLQAQDDLRESQIAAANGNLSSALADANAAVDTQPYAASPRLQRALILELEGDLPAALEASRTAARKEPQNWRNWAVRSRLEARNGNPKAAVLTLERADMLSGRDLVPTA